MARRRREVGAANHVDERGRNHEDMKRKRSKATPVERVAMCTVVRECMKSRKTGGGGGYDRGAASFCNDNVHGDHNGDKIIIQARGNLAAEG